jgi:hypothetical protein
MKTSRPNNINTADTATGADTKSFPQRRVSLIFKVFCFMIYLGFSFFHNHVAANNSKNQVDSVFYIKNFENLKQDDVKSLIACRWNDRGGNWDKEAKKISIGGPCEIYKFNNEDAKKVRSYSAWIWPTNPPIPDSHTTVTLYEDGDYEIWWERSFFDCYWRIFLPTEFSKSDFKKLDKITLQKIISNHVKSRGLHPDTYKVKEFTLKKAKGQKETYFWEVLTDEDPKNQRAKHYFLIYEEKPFDAEDSPQRKPAGSNKSGEKHTEKDEKKPK